MIEIKRIRDVRLGQQCPVQAAVVDPGEEVAAVTHWAIKQVHLRTQAVVGSQHNPSSV
jgi:hypothetical protein